MTEKEVTLEQLLSAREQRAMRQNYLLDAYRKPVISFTINYPGPVKLNSSTREIFRAGAKALEKQLKGNNIRIIHKNTLEQITGNEGLWCIDAEENAVKDLTCRIEESHPLGRLFDMDVIGKYGLPLSRVNAGFAKRTCMICGKDPLICRRRNKHALQEVTAYIDILLIKYLNRGA